MRSWDELHAEAAALAAQEHARLSLKASDEARRFMALAGSDHSSPMFTQLCDLAQTMGAIAKREAALAEGYGDLARSHTRADLRKRGLR
jgi:hypothetical protein